MLGWVEHHDYVLGNTKSPQETLEKSLQLAKKALSMDDSLHGSHSLAGLIYSMRKEHDKGIAEGERALALNPGGAGVIVNYGWSLTIAGRAEEAIPLFEKVIRLTPFGHSSLYREYGFALRSVGRYEDAISAYKKAIQIAPDNLTAHLNLAITYSLIGRGDEARAEAAEVLRINSKFSLDHYAKYFVFRDPTTRDKYVGALRKAGLK